MSTEAPKKHEFIIILPDQEGALERRMEVRGYVLPVLCYPVLLLWDTVLPWRMLYCVSLLCYQSTRYGMNILHFL